MTAPTGPMDPERLADLRSGIEDNLAGGGLPVPVELAAELLADRDHWAAKHDEMIVAELGAVVIAMETSGVSCQAVRATALSRVEEEWLTSDDWAGPIASLRQQAARAADAERFRDQWRRLYADCESKANILRELARAVVDGDGLAAKTLAAEVLDADERGDL